MGSRQPHLRHHRRVAAAACGYVVVTTDQSSYLHLPSVLGVVTGAYILLMAALPDLRGEGGGVRRAVATALFWTTTLAATFVLWRAGI
jgi:hypothetical protein